MRETLVVEELGRGARAHLLPRAASALRVDPTVLHDHRTRGGLVDPVDACVALEDLRVERDRDRLREGIAHDQGCDLPREVVGIGGGGVAVAEHRHEDALVRQPQRVRGEAEDATAVLDGAPVAQLRDDPPVSIASGLSVLEDEGSPGPVERGPRQELLGVEGCIPARQVVHRRGEGSRRVRLRHAQVAGVPRLAALLCVARDPPGDDGRAARVVRRGHAKRSEDPLVDEGLVGLPRGLLHDGAQQDVRRVVVGVPLSGGELHGLLLEAVDQLAHGHGAQDPARHPARHVRVALDAGGVCQEVLDRDHVPLGRVAGQVLLDRILERELPVLRQHQDRCGRELLRDRPEPEDHVRLERHAEFQVGHAVRLPEDGASVLDHDDGGAGTVGLKRSLEKRVDGGGRGCCPGRGGGGRGRGRGEQECEHHARGAESGVRDRRERGRHGYSS